ncbi:uncharacterized protein LOC117478153 [Trematomus bernacchii]|uniref:uncharacterized protein LOC117478153 n=1 Tax=Trematomus bernacchii TaxID=40690 RepID=UPI00146D5D7A|nr:uncharacterized protein LOC117478153 [Trematomus bernacchii]
MLKLNTSRQDGDTQLVEEILHSIFFLGRIMTPPLSPEEIVLDTDYLAGLKKQFPLPFEPSSFSQLPRRSPFSCVLDMIVFLEGPEKEDEIIKRLQKIIRPLNQKLLVPYTICVSQITNNQNSVCRYYGVSMSRMWDDFCLIMISASCLKYWHSDVAGAVMTYHPNVTKHPRFDGTITLPKQVTCETFKLFKVGKVYMPPCIRCQNMFGLKEIDLAEGASAESRIAARSSHTSSTSTAPPP